MTFGRFSDEASSHIRTKIQRRTRPSPWPDHPSDADIDIPVLPISQRFLLGLLTGDDNATSHSERVEILSQYISQDFIYAVTHGKQKTPKHIIFVICHKDPQGKCGTDPLFE